MKSILIIIALLLSIPAVSQPKWEDQIAKRFYSRIDTARSMGCCDNPLIDKKVKKVKVTFDIPVEIFLRDEFLFSNYSENLIDSAGVDQIFTKLISKYHKQFSKRQIRKFKKSCYSTLISSSVHEDLVNNIVYISSRVRFVISFQ